MSELKCLSVRQPWAHLIVHGPKRLENRWRPTTYRGPLLIHASGLPRASGAGPLAILCREEGLQSDQLAYGCVIGRVELVDCFRLEDAANRVLGDQKRFAVGPYCWVLADPQPVEPLPWRGALSFFNVPLHLLREVRV